MPKKVDKRKSKKSKSQITERNKFASLNREWGKLSYEKKLGWTKLAKEDSVKRSGSGKKIKDGQQLFLSYNGFLQQTDEPINKDAPIIKEPQFLTNIYFEIVSKKRGNKMEFYFEPAIDKDTKVLIYSTEALNISGTKIEKKYLRRIVALDSEFLSGSSILARYLRVFKKFPHKGEVIGMKVLSVNRQCGKPGLSYTFPFVIR